MPNLFMTVFQDAKEVAKGLPILEEAVVFAAAGPSVQSSVLPAHEPKLAYRVRIFADGDCFVTWGANPTALQDGSEGRPVGAGNPEYFEIEQGLRLAVIERV